MALNSKFAGYMARMPLLMERLLASEPLSLVAIKRLKSPGVYGFFEDGTPLCGGRTGNFSKRNVNHCGKSSKHNTAAFAFILTREAAGRMKASYKPEGSRAALMKDPEFAAAFDAAKGRVRAMSIPFVKIEDHNEQHMFELYLSLEAGAPYTKLATS